MTAPTTHTPSVDVGCFPKTTPAWQREPFDNRLVHRFFASRVFSPDQSSVSVVKYS